MRIVQPLIVAIALAIGTAAPASAQGGVGGDAPEFILYRFPGVFDNNGLTFTGVATVFHCTNFNGVTETIRFVARSKVGALIANVTISIDHLETETVWTHIPKSYITGTSLGTGGVQGSIAIAATSINIVCSAEIIDASTVAPVGVARRGIRFNPIPGSQE